MKTDLLLEKFNDEQLDMSKVVGGGPIKINGASQDGSHSYIDYIDENGKQQCGIPIVLSDWDGWCESVYMD